MRKTSSRYEMDMTQGPIIMNMIRFSIPLMISGALQLFYNSADMIVVGQFAGSDALAAVGATSAVTMLLVNFFMGLSVGVSVIVGRHYGANEQKDVAEGVHTSVVLAIICGIGIGILGIVLARPLLTAMGTPENIMDNAVIYMQLYFAGMPANLIYNFCASILRAVGDTRRPLYYLTISGIANVVLNLIFVIVFKLSVIGVALGTVISQIISMVLVLACLVRTDSCIHLNPRKLILKGEKALEIIRIGIPSGLQASMFAISNTLIHSSINSFGSAAVAGQTAAQNIEHFISTPLTAFQQAALSFTSQNYGARKPERFNKILACASFLTMGLGLLMTALGLIFCRPLMRLYTDDLAAIEWGVIRMHVVTTFISVACLSNIFVSCLRGMGNSTFPMVTSIICICVVRVVWVWTAFAAWPTEEVLYCSYPISFVLAATAHFITLLVYQRKVTRRLQTVR